MTETSLIVLGLKRNLQAVENTDIRKVALKKNHCRNSEIQLFHFNIVNIASSWTSAYNAS